MCARSAKHLVSKNHKAAATVANLERLGQALNVPVKAFFEVKEEERSVAFGELVVHLDAGKSRSEKMLSHAGDEYNYVLKGDIWRVTFGNQ